jgi:hypothetical protein
LLPSVSTGCLSTGAARGEPVLLSCCYRISMCCLHEYHQTITYPRTCAAYMITLSMRSIVDFSLSRLLPRITSCESRRASAALVFIRSNSQSNLISPLRGARASSMVLKPPWHSFRTSRAV